MQARRADSVRAMVLRCRYRSLPRVAIALAFAGAALSGCAPSTSLDDPQFVTSGGTSSPERAYRIGIGDQLKVTVFGEDNLSGEFEVNAQGQVSLPLIGEQQAKGLTLQEFRQSLIKRLADGYLKSPRVTADILNYRPIYVHGEVKNAGEFKYKTGLTLRDAIAMAGGYTYRANEDYTYFARHGEPDVAVNTRSEIVILPGDNIRVPERFF